jgi:hypothetical protein
MREARLQELEGMAAALLATARQLPSGQDRHNALREVGKFRAQIAALQRIQFTARGLKVKGK